MTATAKKKTDEPWREHLILSTSGAIKPLLANAITALSHSTAWQGVLAFDMFAQQTVIVDAPPWLMDGWAEGDAIQWTTNDDILTANWLQQKGIGVSVAVAAQAVECVAKNRQFHPVLDYLDDLKHDGQARAENWLTTYLGAEPTPYNKAVGKAMLIAAIARIRVPGCKVDTVPILEGPQGSRKSTAIKTLFEPWFSDELADLGSKDSAMQARGVWGLEVSELDAMSRGEVSRIKAFISRTTDRFRPPYGSRIIESPRACVFWGTTNVDGYLKDESGGRRFWPVKVGKIDIDGLREARDQLWAEAQVLFDANVPWWLVKDDHVRAAEEQQLDRYGGDPWDDAISRYVAGETEVSIEKVLRDGLGLEISRTGQTEMNRVVRSLRALGFNRVQVRRGDKRVRVYRKPMTASDTCDDFPGDRPMASNVTTLRTGDTFGPVTQEVPAAQALSPLSQQSPRF